MTAALLAAGVPTLACVPAVVLGIVKDGSPLRREWWTS